jgi:DNA-binding CsgD family transcriptional regulator
VLEPAGIVERDAERAALDEAAAAAARGEGAVVLAQGEAGIGKTALLTEARARAEGHGLRVLSAIGSELEREFPFGLVHQLLGPVLAAADDEGRAALLSGAARGAAAVLAPPADAGPAAPDPGYAVLYGLYWLLAGLAEQQPLALVVDDLHWADAASLRLLDFVGRRLDGVPVLVAGALRPAEPGAEAALLTALATGPRARVLQPAPLSPVAVAGLLAGTLATEPEPGFVAAAARATGGNPLLLRALAREAATAGLRGTGDEVDGVARLGAAGVAPAVRRRVHALGDDAVAVVQAAALLGARHEVADVAAVAGLDPAAARAAVDRLVAADVLDAEGRAFVHPLLREAIAREIPPARRAELHRGAARRLRERGARDDEVAVHLMATDPAGDPEVVAALRRAARRAIAEGAPEVAIVQLRRALTEPPPEADRAELLLELGELGVRTGDPEAVEHLDAALREGLDGDAAARAWAARGIHVLFVDPVAAIDEIERAAQGASDLDLQRQLEALVLEASTYDVRAIPRRRALLASGAAAGAPSPVMLAHLSFESGYAGGPAAETARLARSALQGGELLRVLGPDSSTINLLAHGLRYAEQPALVARVVEEADADVRRTGMTLGALFIDHVRAYQQLSFGSVAAGLAHGQTGLEKALHADWPVPVQAFTAIVVELLLELDRVEDAAAAVDAIPEGPAADGTIAGPFLVAARGGVRWAQGDADEAQRLLRRAVHLLDARGWHAPLVTSARLRLAELLAARGDRDEALELADGAAAVADVAGTSGALGAARRVRGQVLGGDEGLAELEAAVAALEGAPLALERGWALHGLGTALRRAGRKAEAREPLRRALEIAQGAEAALLERRAREELAVAGARPRRSELQGPGALTPAERRVAELAGAGRSNREIAEELWVTRKTVEMHLSNAYNKLGIRSRTQLAGRLGTPAAPAA